jgi:hypothetical protein
MAVECAKCHRHILETDNRLPPWCPSCGGDLKGAAPVMAPAPPRTDATTASLRTVPAAALESRVEGRPVRLDDIDSLGIPERVYRGSIVRQLLCWLGTLIGGAFLALIVYITFHPPKKPVSDAAYYGLTGFGLIAAFGSTYFALKFRGLTYLVFADALVRRDGGESTIIRWENVRQVFEKVHLGYINYRVVARAGEFELTGDIAGHRSLGTTIEDRLLAHRLPAALQELEQGHTVPFGPLAVSRAALWCDGQEMAWHTVRLSTGLKPDHAHRTTMLSNMIHLHVHSNGPTVYLEIERIPNYRLFVELVRHVWPQCLPDEA